MSKSTIEKTIFINASREVVWRYLTEKDKLALWFHPAAADLVEGREYALIKESEDGVEKLCWGDVLSMNPPESMEWTFTVQPLGGAMTTVLWTLEEVHGGTRVSLKHTGIGEAAQAAALGLLMALDAGWDEHFARLRVAISAG